MRYPRVVHRYLLVAVVCCCIAPRETNQSFANKCTCSRVRLVLCTGLLHSPVGLSVPGYRHAGCLQLSHHRPPEMCGLRTRPRTDVDPPRRLDPWTDADGLIGCETTCHRRTTCTIGGGGISSRRPRCDTLLGPVRGALSKHWCDPSVYLSVRLFHVPASFTAVVTVEHK